MKKNILLSALTSFLALLLAINNCWAINEDPTIVKKFSVTEPAMLNMVLSSGKVKVKGHEGNQAVINIFIMKKGKVLSYSDPLMNKVREIYEWSVKEKNNELEIIVETTYDWTHFFWKSQHYFYFSFEILVPKSTVCDIKTAGGAIQLANVKGEQQLSTSGGSIQLANIIGKVNATTSGGKISMKNQNGDTQLATSGGGIFMERGKGNIAANTSGGSIVLEAIHGKVDASTSGGSIKVTGSSSSIQASTSGGSIHVDVKNLKNELYLSTSGGGIYATLPDHLGMDLNLKGSHVKMDLKNFSGTADDDKVEGKINDGGIPVTMTTSGGSVVVELKSN